MYKVMIAEDEPFINDSIRKMIEMLDLRFSVGACVYDGDEAVQRLKEGSFDVVFTDIRMPGMDGLELLKYISENYPRTITVVLSGYEIFDYAQKALKYRVFEYLLKPVTITEIKELLERIADQLEKRAEVQKEEYYHRVFSGVEKDEASRQNRKYWYKMFLINMGSVKDAEDFMEKGNLSEKAGADDVRNRMDELLVKTDTETWIWFSGRFPEEYVLIEEYEKNAAESGAGTAKKLCASLCSISPITVLEGRQLQDINALYGEYRTLHKWLTQHLVFGSSSYLTLNEIKKSGYRQLSEEEKESLYLLAKAGHIKNLENRIEMLLEDCAKRGLTQKELEREIQQSFAVIIKGVRAENHFSQTTVEHEVHVSISLADNYRELCLSLMDMLYAVMGKQNEGEEERLVDTIRQYLDENYSEKITTKDLSKKFGLVPSYLSMLFRQAHGMSPSDYVNNLRISRAKQLLLEDVSLSVKEIAEMVGYTDQLYFSKVFKKETGKTPSSFRQVP